MRSWALFVLPIVPGACVVGGVPQDDPFLVEWEHEERHQDPTGVYRYEVHVDDVRVNGPFVEVLGSISVEQQLEQWHVYHCKEYRRWETKTILSAKHHETIRVVVDPPSRKGVDADPQLSIKDAPLGFKLQPTGLSWIDASMMDLPAARLSWRLAGIERGELKAERSGTFILRIGGGAVQKAARVMATELEFAIWMPDAKNAMRAATKIKREYFVRAVADR